MLFVTDRRISLAYTKPGTVKVEYCTLEPNKNNRVSKAMFKQLENKFKLYMDAGFIKEVSSKKEEDMSLKDFGIADIPKPLQE